MTNISLYRITPGESLPLEIQADSLDELTPQLPAGYYTTFRTYGGGERVLGLRAHLQRLYQPLTNQNIVPEVSQKDLRWQMVQVLKTRPGESRARLIMSKSGEIYLAISPLENLSPEHYQQGVRVVTTDLRRDSPRIKATSFISNSQVKRNELSKSSIFEALLVKNNRILEGITSNFFYIRDEVLGTARKDILLGVTRKTVLRVARGSGLEIVYRSLNQEQVPALSEAFLTSSSRGIVPIIQIDEMQVGQGVPGPITKKLMEGYKEYVIERAELI